MKTNKIVLIDLGQFNSKYLQDVMFSWHNHGLGMLAAICKQQGINVDYIGLKYLSCWEEFAIKISGYDIAAISMMSSDYPQAMTAVNIIKGANPNCKIIIGGIGVTVNPEILLKNEKIDYILTGEGDITFPEFLSNPNKFSREIKGQPVKDLDGLPFLDRGIYPEPLEKNVPGWGGGFAINVFTARGCVYNCTFCQPASRNHFGSKVKRRSVKNVMAEVNEINTKYKPDFIVFHDECFTYSPKWLDEFVHGYKIGVPFFAASKADFVCANSEMMHKLKEVGLKIISIGFESGSQRILDMINKRTTIEQNYKAAEVAGRAGVRIFANIMYGFPTETKEEQFATYRLCKYISTFDSMVSPAYFTPFPGSKLGDECRSNGLNLINEYNCNRFGRDKIKGVDYDFLDSFIWRV